MASHLSYLSMEAQTLAVLRGENVAHCAKLEHHFCWLNAKLTQLLREDVIYMYKDGGTFWLKNMIIWQPTSKVTVAQITTRMPDCAHETSSRRRFSSINRELIAVEEGQRVEIERRESLPEACLFESMRNSH